MEAPHDWSSPDGFVAFAQREVAGAFGHPNAAELVARYYEHDGNYAGNTFLDLQPTSAARVTAVDLFAVTLLDVPIPPLATRQILAAEMQNEIAAHLREVHEDVRLESARPDDFLAAEKLYLLLKGALGKNPWVTASKLCARKRPLFFPVRDRVVTERRLRLGKDYQVDWQVMGMLVEEFADDLEHLAEESGNITDPPLKVLDALLWMTADHRMSTNRE